MNGSGARLEIIWKGELVGYLEDADLETIDLGNSYKTRGRWVPLALPATEAFIRLLRESRCPEVEIDEDTPGMKTVFSLGLDGEAWLYRRDLIGWKRFLDSSDT